MSAFQPPDLVTTKSGQPKMGSTFTLDNGEQVRIVGKLWGKGGSAHLVGIVVEFDLEADGLRPSDRLTLEWPLRLASGGDV